MINEHYYRQNLENAINEWLIQECEETDHELEWIPDTLHRRMADAAFTVLLQNIETQLWLDNEKLLKDSL